MSEHGKSPAFQFYPKDFLSDSNVVCMSLQERGVYITLLCRCWLDSSLPADEDRLARLCGVPLAVFRKFWPAVGVCFRPHPDQPDRIVHPRLEREREKQDYFRRRQSDNGRLGGRPRKPTDNPNESQTKGLGFSGLTQTKAKKSSPICYLQSANSSERENQHAHTEDDVAERAARFLERYADLHQKYRSGAAYVGKMHLDFMEAKQLVSVYDDERLDKLAIVFLNADDEFSSNGTRTLAKFRSRASWCDERLRQKGL